MVRASQRGARSMAPLNVRTNENVSQYGERLKQSNQYGKKTHLLQASQTQTEILMLI